jgi:hypothetical protein
MRCLRKAVNKTRLDKVRNTDVRNTIRILPCLEFIEQQRHGLATLSECNMTSQQPKLTTPGMRDTDIKEDQEKDGLTVFQKHAPKKE